MTQVSVDVVQNSLLQGEDGSLEVEINVQEAKPKERTKISTTKYEALSVPTVIPTRIEKSSRLSTSSQFSSEMECDYETNPTALYKLLEKSEWRLASIRVQAFDDEAQTWVTRRDRHSDTIRWRMLPLHAAILFRAPKDVVDAILKCFPEGAKKQDDHGMLPLHLAFRNPDPDQDTIDLLLKTYPEGIYVKDSKGRIPLSLAHNSSGKQSSEPSAKTSQLMKLYAEAAFVVQTRGDGSQNVIPSSDISPNSPTSVIHLSSHEERNPPPTTVVEGCVVSPKSALDTEEHKEQIRALAKAHEEQLKRIFAEHEEHTTSLQSNYDEQVLEIDQKWAAIVDKQKIEHTEEMDKILSDKDAIIAALKKEHDEQLDKLRSSIDDDVKNTKDLNICLKEEVEDLKKQLRKAKNQCDIYKTIMEGTKRQQNQLASDIQAMAQDQDEIIQYVLHQREEVETAYAVRDKLINTLLTQEDDDRLMHIQAGEDLMDLIESGRDRMEAIMKRCPGVVTGGTSVAHSTSGSIKGGGSVASFGLGLSSIKEDLVDDEDKGSEHADDISAITDHSGY